MLARKMNCTRNIQPFTNIFFFYKKPSTPIFFICLYFIGAGADENLKIYLVWPYRICAKTSNNAHADIKQPGLEVKILLESSSTSILCARSSEP